VWVGDVAQPDETPRTRRNRPRHQRSKFIFFLSGCRV
jgi:hypothetical protein